MKFLTLLCYILRSVFLRGPFRSLRMAFSEASGDKHFNIKTRGLQLEKKAGHHNYQGASYLVLEQIFSVLAELQVPNRIVDVGSGLGRVLFFAERNGFEWLRGIEMNAALVEGAMENEKQFIYHNPSSNLLFCHVDALKFDYPEQETVYFFFNPFEANILSACLDRILSASNSSNWFVYMNPLFHSVFEEKGFKKVSEIKTHFYTEAIVYRS